MIQTVLIDDEAPARDELRYLLEKNHTDTINVVGEADTATGAISLITRIKPDLIFLDIHMHGLTGLELAQIIHDISPNSIIVFATAYDEYALKAFELHALDYIVKPIEEKRLADIVSRAATLHAALTGAAQLATGSATSSTQEVHATTDTTKATHHSATSISKSTPDSTTKANNDNGSDMDPSPLSIRTNKIAVDDGAHIILLDIDTIYYITGESGHLEVHTSEGIFHCNKTLTELQNRLQGTPIYRVHRSYIVNLNCVKEVVPWFKSTYWLRVPDKTSKGMATVDIPVSKTQVKTIKELLGIS